MAQPHSHSDIEINFLLPGGHVRYMHGGTIYTIQPERLAILWGGIPHQTLAPGVTGEGIWITLPLAWFLQWNFPNNFSHKLLTGEIIQGTPQIGDLDMFERWIEDYEDGTKERRRILLLEMEARLHRIALEQPRRRAPKSQPTHVDPGVMQIQRVTQFIAEQYRGPINAQDIADAVGLNVKYLMRLFKKNCNISIWDYLTRLRISHAQRLLITTDQKVLDIALDSGFASVAPFYAAFKKHSHGLRPQGYRERHSFGEMAGK